MVVMVVVVVMAVAGRWTAVMAVAGRWTAVMAVAGKWMIVAGRWNAGMAVAEEWAIVAEEWTIVAEERPSGCRRVLGEMTCAAARREYAASCWRYSTRAAPPRGSVAAAGKRALRRAGRTAVPRRVSGSGWNSTRWSAERRESHVGMLRSW